jgi:hypothetical protein
VLLITGGGEYCCVPYPEPVEDPLELEELVEACLTLVALCPRAGSLPEAISTEISAPIASAPTTASVTILTVTALVDGGGLRYLRY